MSASTFAISLGLFFYSILDVINYKKEIENNAYLNAALVGEYCRAPLTFRYKEETAEALKKLNKIPVIINACVYDSNDKLFAAYNKNISDTFTFPKLTDKNYAGDKNHLHIFKTLDYDNEKYGTIYLRVSTASINQKIINNIYIACALLIILFFPIYFLASILQKIISRPIIKLAGIADEVAQTQNYSIQVEPENMDVIGNLYKRFNEMLIQINKRQQKIDFASNELKNTNSQLIKELNERLKAEEKLRNSEEQFRLIYENVADMIVVLDLQGKRVYNNPSYEPLLGSVDSLIGTDSFKDVHPDDRERIKNIFQNTVKTGIGHQSEYRMIDKDGNIHFIESNGSVIHNKQGEVLYVVVVSRDVTERKIIEQELKKLNEELEDRVKERTQELLKEIETRKNTEKALKESEQRLENILNYAPILVYINDLEGRYIFVNKEFERLMELPYYQIIGKKDSELFPKERSERNIAQNKMVISAKSARIFENESHKKDGTHYFVDILFPIIDSNNEVYATCGWSIDITDRKKTERILLEAKERAESADRLKSAFLATMSHELRTPLNSIIGFTGILMKQIAGPLNDEQLKQLGMAKASAQHLLALINDVLDISKIEAGQLVVSYKNFNFYNMINKVISSVQPLADKKNIKLLSEIDPDVKELFSDERRVEQILINIINNAIKFTDMGFVKIKSERVKDNIVVKVIDSGIGIKKEDLDKLFKPFIQVDSGLARNHEGTGLGLSISQKLIDKLNGTISVESEIGKGSTFTITFPLSKSE
jgi:PAS domain S-box-containing protein